MTNKKHILDAWLVVEAQSGNKKAFAILVKRWHPKLCKQAYWYTKDHATAQDIAQDSWGVMLQKLKELEDVNCFGGWALKIVTRKALDVLRKQKRELNQLKQEYDSSNQINFDDKPLDPSNPIVLLNQAIRKLPSRQQQVLTLFYLEEYSIQQLSEILNISKGTVKSRLFTAREKLKTILKNRNHEK